MTSPTTVKTIALYGVETGLHTDWEQKEVALDTTSNWVENNNPAQLVAPEIVQNVLKSILQSSIRGLYQQSCRVGAGSSLTYKSRQAVLLPSDSVSAGPNAI